MSLSLLTGCEHWSPEDVFDFIDALGELQKGNPGAKAPSFEMTDPNRSNHVKKHPSNDGPDFPEGENQNPESSDDGGGSVPGGMPQGHGDSDGAAKIIAEADLIQRRDNTLYALSQDRGLTLINIADPNNLQILGEFRSDARAFEMYVEEGIVFAMMRDVMVEDEENDTFPFQPYKRMSAFVVLDAKDPAKITQLKQFQVPGRILDSRRIEDRVYVMSYQNSYCWRCDDRPLVRVTSFDVQDPKNPVQVQALDLPIPERSWGPEPSLMSTDRHLYVAMVDRNNKEGAFSSIRSIDISNPDAMAVGADIPLQGAVNSRWQMNEYQDVLRVVTQPSWNMENPPVVETFGVKDIASPTKLGQLTMTLPRPEQLQSVRFDKDRAYAITFERTDPLFILDLKDPKKPVQRGELEIPGWVYHMEPRGDRLIGIGFDRTEPSGHLHASLFDVSNMDKPTMLSRVNFGGQWANFAEGQNQIHKSLRIWDDKNLLAIPYSGGGMFVDEEQADDGETIKCENYDYQSGIMLVDWKDDALVLRGEVDIDGQAKRSFLHDEHLFAVSTQSVASFDISNRDEPKELSSINTTINVDKLVPAGENLWLRRKQISHSKVEFDIVTTQELDGFNTLGTIRYEAPKEEACNSYYHHGEVFVQDGFVYLEVVVHPRYQGSEIGQRSIISFDIRDPQNPQFVQKSPVLGSSRYGSSESIGNLRFSGSDLLHDGTDLFVTLIEKEDWRQREFDSQVMIYKLDQGSVVKKHGFSRKDVRYAGTVRKMANGRYSSWFARATNPKDETKITIFWEDIKTEDRFLSVKETAVPGVPLLISPAGNAMLSLGFEHKKIKVDSSSECYFRNGVDSFDHRTGTCTINQRILHRVSLLGDTPQILGSEPLLEKAARTYRILQSPDRVAYSLTERFFHPMPEPGIGIPGIEQPMPDFDVDGEDQPDSANEGKKDEVDEAQDPEEKDSDDVDTQEDEPIVPGPGIKPFPTRQQKTQILSINDFGALTRVNLPQTKDGSSGQVRFLGPKDLLRRSNRIERFDLSSMSNIRSREYDAGRRAGMCRELHPSQDNLVCAAYQSGVLEFPLMQSDSE